MRLILLGCPGAGKGTQAKLITAKYNIPQISTGDILRSAIEKGTDLGNKVKSIVEEGRLVPDELMNELVFERIQQPDCQNGFLLDGYPRTAAQAEALRQYSDIDYVIDIDVPDEEVVKRLSGRRVHPASGRSYHIIYQAPKQSGKDDLTGEPLVQRADDAEETVRKRLALYDAKTKPLKEYYQHFPGNGKAPKYVRIDGIGSVEAIQKQIISLLNKG